MMAITNHDPLTTDLAVQCIRKPAETKQHEPPKNMKTPSITEWLQQQRLQRLQNAQALLW
jgi:hypothetical protein